MAKFYDHENGKLYFRAPAGAGGSIWDAPATPADIAANPAAHREYTTAKRTEAEGMQAAKAEMTAIDALKAENAMLHEHIADLAAETAVDGSKSSE